MENSVDCRFICLKTDSKKPEILFFTRAHKHAFFFSITYRSTRFNGE